MDWFNKVFEFILKRQLFLKNCIIILLLSRVFALEENKLALIAEIIGGLIIILDVFAHPSKHLKSSDPD